MIFSCSLIVSAKEDNYIEFKTSDGYGFVDLYVSDSKVVTDIKENNTSYDINTTSTKAIFRDCLTIFESIIWVNEETYNPTFPGYELTISNNGKVKTYKSNYIPTAYYNDVKPEIINFLEANIVANVMRRVAIIGTFIIVGIIIFLICLVIITKKIKNKVMGKKKHNKIDTTLESDFLDKEMARETNKNKDNPFDIG
jgi:hypothetical protein